MPPDDALPSTSGDFPAVVAVASAAVALLFIGLGLLLAPTADSPVAIELPTSWGVVILVCGLVGLRLAWRLQGGDASGARAWCLLMALLSLPSLPYSLPVALPALFGAWRLWEGVPPPEVKAARAAAEKARKERDSGDQR